MTLIDVKELLNERPENLNPNMNDEIKSAYNRGWNACNSEWIHLINEWPRVCNVDKTSDYECVLNYSVIKYAEPCDNDITK